jgi:hypothetical protein
LIARLPTAPTHARSRAARRLEAKVEVLQRPEQERGKGNAPECDADQTRRFAV